MYRVWPCPLTRTVPTPGTLVAPIVAEAADEARAGALLAGEPAAVLEDDEPHAATVAAAPSAKPPASSQLLSGPRRRLTLSRPHSRGWIPKSSLLASLIAERRIAARLSVH